MRGLSITLFRRIATSSSDYLYQIVTDLVLIGTQRGDITQALDHASRRIADSPIITPRIEAAFQKWGRYSNAVEILRRRIDPTSDFSTSFSAWTQVQDQLDAVSTTVRVDASTRLVGFLAGTDLRGRGFPEIEQAFVTQINAETDQSKQQLNAYRHAHRTAYQTVLGLRRIYPVVMSDMSWVGSAVIQRTPNRELLACSVAMGAQLLADLAGDALLFGSGPQLVVNMGIRYGIQGGVSYLNANSSEKPGTPVQFSAAARVSNSRTELAFSVLRQLAPLAAVYALSVAMTFRESEEFNPITFGLPLINIALHALTDAAITQLFRRMGYTNDHPVPAWVNAVVRWTGRILGGLAFGWALKNTLESLRPTQPRNPDISDSCDLTIVCDEIRSVDLAQCSSDAGPTNSPWKYQGMEGLRTGCPSESYGTGDLRSVRLAVEKLSYACHPDKNRISAATTIESSLKLGAIRDKMRGC
ncbi:hypothetical protein EBR96_04780 [bacterium]|nr:hypothetical protein [bacterium]